MPGSLWRLPVLTASLALAWSPGCFTSPPNVSKILCNQTAYCPQGYLCVIPKGSTQGSCQKPADGGGGGGGQAPPDGMVESDGIPALDSSRDSTDAFKDGPIGTPDSGSPSDAPLAGLDGTRTDTEEDVAGGGGSAGTTGTGSPTSLGGTGTGLGGAPGAGGAGGMVGSGGITPSGGTTSAGGIKGSGGIVGSGGTTVAAMTCPTPAEFNNGTVSAPTLTVSSEATYTCFSGYSLVGVDVRTCQADGTWNGAQPTCVPVDCGALASPQDGSVAAPTTTYGSTASYSCTAGHTISSNTPRTCEANGTWSGSAPTCTAVDCGTPPAASTYGNGAVSYTTTTYNSTATYSCGSGFSLSTGGTTPTLTCGASGAWSSSAPTCLGGFGSTCSTSQNCISGATCCSGSTGSCDGTLLPAGDGTNTAELTVSSDGLTVTDTITGLVWQRDGSGARSNCASNPECTWAEATAYCASLSLGGVTGWRLPAVMELTTILDLVVTSGATIDPTAFPSTPTDYKFWTSSPYSYSSGYAWAGDFSYGDLTDTPESTTLRVRCVSGSRCYPTSRFVALAGNLVQDTLTGLAWQQQPSTTAMTWADAGTYCASAGSGFRLPTVKELSSIVDFTVASPGPAINPTAFPNTANAGFWTSSPWNGSAGYVWDVSFYDGSAETDREGDVQNVRCVR